MKNLHYNNWTDDHFEMLREAKTFRDLAKVAFGVISMSHGEVHMVSGPISTGGVGDIPGNRRVFEGVIEILAEEQGLNLFSQMPFEDKMVEMHLVWHAANPTEPYCTPILDDFYAPVFASGLVRVLHFIHGWESSFGARWEHDNCDLWRIERRYLPPELSFRALNRQGVPS